MKRLILSLMVLGVCTTGFSKTHYVNNNADSGPGSLRNTIAGAAKGDTIKFKSITTIGLSSTLEINKTLYIIGNEKQSVVLDGQDKTAILRVVKPAFSRTATAYIYRIQFINGKNGKFPRLPENGGGILNHATLYLSHCRVLDCYATGDGGGIYNEGNLYVYDTEISGNRALLDGGGIMLDTQSGKVEIRECKINNNEADHGAAVYSFVDFSCENSIIRSNICNNNSGAVHFKMTSNDTSQFISTTIDSNSAIGLHADGPIEMHNGNISYNGSIGINMMDYGNMPFLDILNTEIQSNGQEGISLDESCNLFMENCRLKMNSRGVFAFAENLLDINQSEFVENITTSNGGGIYSANDADLILNETTFSKNEANKGGAIAGLFEEVTIDWCQFNQNKCQTDGGGISLLSLGPVHVNNSVFSQNECVDYGGGCYLKSYEWIELNLTRFMRNTSGSGGALFNENDSLILNSVQMQENYAATDGGGIFNTLGGNIYAFNCTLHSNTADQDGGGLYNGFAPGYPTSGMGSYIEMDSCRVHANLCDGDGAGINNTDYLLLTRSSIRANHAQSNGGGFYNEGEEARLITEETSFTLNTANNGGGICNMKFIEMDRCNISGNSVDNRGAGIYNISTDPCEITNTTFYENLCSASGQGGGMYGAGMMTELINCTFNKNKAMDGASINNMDPGLMISNTIMANCLADSEFSGTVPSVNNHNLVMDGSLAGAATSDPQLLPYGDYGGLTLSCALAAESPAIDAGDNSAISCTWDQCNNPRFYNSVIDIGAVEFQGATEVETKQLPEQFALFQNYPNPFNAVTTIRYKVADPTTVLLLIYDIKGRLASTLVNEQQTPGEYQVRWQADPFSSGLYFFRLKTETFDCTKSMILLK
ncbi:MAG: choice-of-anchor Q domain-containing protein [candidate division KSB1 bacterium]|nr:choice-of-anchor Q domain-containing protein [candidate division KSB1 bacterium]